MSDLEHQYNLIKINLSSREKAIELSMRVINDMSTDKILESKLRTQFTRLFKMSLNKKETDVQDYLVSIGISLAYVDEAHHIDLIKRALEYNVKTNYVPFEHISKMYKDDKHFNVAVNSYLDETVSKADRVLNYLK